MAKIEKRTYPAIFQYDPIEGEEYQYTVIFPDLPGCVTEGRTFEEAIEMAQDAMALYLFDMDSNSIPSPSGFIHTGENEALVMITVNMDAFREAMESKSVKKTLTIPAKLNAAAENAGVNFSQVLQTALKNYLDIN